MSEDIIIREFLGDNPDSGQYKEWREILEARLKGMQRDAARSSPGDAASLELRMATLRKQIAALRQEEAITEFVEDSVRVTLAMGATHRGTDADEADEVLPPGWDKVDDDEP